MNGIEFLRGIKADDELKRIPVIVLTTSKDEEDKLESFNLGVAGYLVKRVEYDEFLKTIATFEKYWSLCQLP
jgi:CheY-like chemotaxis protein